VLRLRRVVVPAGLVYLAGIWLAGDVIAVLQLFGPARPWTTRLLALAWLVLWLPAGSLLVSALLGGLRRDVIRADEAGLHRTHRFWGFRRRELRLAWSEIFDVAPSHDGQVVLVSSTTGSHRLTDLGTPQQRADLIADLTGRIAGASRTLAATGPKAPGPPGAGPATADGAQSGWFLHRTWPEARAAAIRRGVLAVLFWALAGWLAGSGSWFAVAAVIAALVASTSAITLVRTSPGWLLQDGRLRVGQVRPRDGRWIDPPQTVRELRLELERDGEGVTTARLIAVLESGDRYQLARQPAERADLRYLGSWLAARADLPFVDSASARP
jgi:hypothetical protein